MALALVAGADEVRTKDGSVVLGKVVNLTGGNLKLKTTFAGELTIPWDQVVQIKTDKPLPIEMGDQGTLTATLRSPEPGQVEVLSASEEVAGKMELARITRINPPPPPPVAWHGAIRTAVTKTAGNTENTTGLLRADAVRRTERDRITLGAGWNYRETEDELTERNAYGFGKYDFFMTKRLFAYGNFRLESDEFKDLALRTIIGGGLGYQFVETDRTNFYGEAGVAYVNEDFDEAEDEDYTAGRLAYNFQHWLAKDVLRFLQAVEWLVSVEDTDDWLLNTDTSLRLKISTRWSADASVIYSHDNSPAPGTEEEDILYALGLAYEF